MPTLQFKGKNIIWNHHLSVPYHALEDVQKLHFQLEKANGNLIIEGDNLLALKALLPMYAGKVKCICIDPPYNTGNEGWAYNDKVNSPLVQDWLDKEVGKDDLTRHDKWLCMMTPRLKLLRELLADDGAIFINIDDLEFHRLRLLCDEVFGEDNFITAFIWKSRQNVDSRSLNGVSNDHEYILCYSKSINYKIRGKEIDISKYKNPDNDPRGPWMSSSLDGLATAEMRPNLHYAIANPENGKKYNPASENGWRFQRSTVETIIKEGRMLWPKNDKSKPRFKRYLNERQSEFTGFSSILETVFTEQGTRELRDIMGEETIKFPKPVDLIKSLLIQATDKSSLILDSFSGSGTTGHAVLDLNKQDGGNRRFILVQMTEATEKEPNKNICKDITRERIKRGIEKYGYDSGFQYLRIGQSLDAETLLEGSLPDYKTFARYVYYLCTGENLKISPDPSLPKRGRKIPPLEKEEFESINEDSFFVGTFGKQAIYLIYKQDFDELTRLALNLDIAEKIIAEQPDKKRIVYAPACFLDEEYMEANQIEFVSIPYNLFQRKI